jgi:hypothetical protein
MDHEACGSRLDETRKNSYDQFNYAPYMTVNVAVRNWRFL